MVHLWRLPRTFQHLLCAYTPPQVEKTFYLTFDDGPTSATEALLHILPAYDYRATFFWLWSQYRSEVVECVAPLLRAQGHNVALHGMNHLSLWRKGSIRRELSHAAYLWQRTGVPFMPYYRPPFGHIRRGSLPEGWRLVLWDLMPPDYLASGGWEKALLSRLRAGDVVVLHERQYNISAWRRFFSAAAESGWRAVALPQAVSVQRAAPVTSSTETG